jgi:predicted Zn-dependent peptidase
MIKEYALENGLRIIADVMPHRNAVSISLWIRVGHRSESRHFGITHFLEHVVFLGSRKFPGSRRLSFPVEKAGGGIGGECSHEYTVYSVKIPKQYARMGLDILLDMVFFPLMEEDRMTLERNVIFSEIDLYRDENFYFINSNLLQHLIWGTHPLGRTGLGTRRSIEGTSTASLKDYWKKYYTPANMILSIAGNADTDSLISFINDKIGSISGSPPSPWKRYDEVQKEPRFSFYRKKTHQAFISFGFRCPSYLSEKIYPLRLVNMFLGEGMSSLLFEEIRHRRGLAYDIHSALKLYSDCGSLLIYAEVHPDNARYAVELIQETIEQLKRSGLSETELEEVKRQYLGSLQLKLENLSFTADWTATNLLLRDEKISFETVRKKVARVSCEDIQNCIDEIFSRKGTNLVLLGPREVKVSL